MSLRSFALMGLLALAACGGGGSESAAAAQVRQSADSAVSSGLAGIVLQHLDDGGTAEGIAGLRQMGTATQIQPGDAFMIGSTTKAMTSALAGRLVERGAIAWTTTLAEALPDLAAGMKPAYRGITLEQLLGHKGGLLSFKNGDDTLRFLAYLQDYKGPLPTTLAGRERVFAAWLLAQDPPPDVTPGRTYFYSNAGYAMAALMLEARTGRPFAELFEQELAKPLGMTVGWTSASQVFTDRPVGHVGARGKLAPVAPLDAEISAWVEVLRPAGEGSTLTPDSYAAWVRWHLRALRGETTPLPAGYLQRIKALKAGDYALGWIARDVDGRPVLAHDGEVRGFCSLLVMDARGRSASFAFTNTEPDDGVWVFTALTQALLDIERALPPQ